MEKKQVQDQLDTLSKFDKTISKGDEQTIDKLSLELKSLEMRLHTEAKDRKAYQQ